MWDAVQQGWLSDLKGKRVITQTSLDAVKTTAGDFNQKQLEDTINIPERNRLIANTWLKHAELSASYRKTVAFCVDIMHAKDLAQAFVDADIPAKAVWGVDPERSQKLKSHSAGDFLVLCNAQMLTEGYDDPTIQCIIMAKPTKSPSLYTQCVGRGTRLQEGIHNLLEARKQGIELSKTDCLVLDFVDVTKKHKLITTASLIGLDTELDLKGQSALAVKQRVEEIQKQFPEADLTRLKDLDQISGEVIDVDLWKVEFADEVKKESRFQWHKQEEGRYFLYISSTDYATLQQDMLERWHVYVKVGNNNIKEKFTNRRESFQFAERMVSLCNSDRARFLQRTVSWEKKPANQMQIAYLQRYGMQIRPDLTWGEANNLINRMRAARAVQAQPIQTGAQYEL